MNAADEGPDGLLPTGRTALFAIIGRPVTQVKAPGIFNRYFAAAEHDAVFVALDLDPGHLAAYFDTMRHTANFRGGFVTVPHKQEAATCMDQLTERARTLGAVNVVKRLDGELIGDMTDGAAFVEASRARGLEPDGARVAMIGGGAAATAIAHAFADAGVAELAMSVRRESRHEPLRRVVESVARPPHLRFDLDSLEGFDMVVNGTSVGMGSDPDVPHPTDTLDPTSLVGEVVTEPRVTPWLRAALDRGCRVQYGVDMTKAQRQMVGPWWGFDMPPIDWDEE